MTSETDACTTVSAAEARERLDELLARVAEGRERIVIERDGRPAAVLAPVDDASRNEGEGSRQDQAPKGALGLVGLWADLMSDEEIEQMVSDIYAARDRDVPRPVNLDFDS